MKLILYHERWLFGQHRIPAGFVPLVTEGEGTVTGVDHQANWILYDEKTRMQTFCEKGAQREALTLCFTELGGTKEAAKKMDVSHRTIESWRAGAKIMPLNSAMRLALLLLE